MITTPPLLLLLLATVPSPKGLPDEWGGLEFSPAATHAGSMPELSGRRSPARGSLGLGAGLNLLRRGHGRLYWTPLHLELRVSRYGPETIQAAAQMEAGGVLLRAGRLRLELGGAILQGELTPAQPWRGQQATVRAGSTSPEHRDQESWPCAGRSR